MPRLHNERLAKDVEGFECGPCAGTGAKALTASPTATSGTAAVAPAAPAAAVAPAAPAAPVAAEGVSERRVWQIH